VFCQDRLGTNVWQQRHCCCTRCRITRASRSSASPTRWQTRSVRRQQPRNNADALQLCRVLVLMQTDHLPRQAQTDANALNRKRRFVCTGTAGNELNFHSWFDPTGAKRHFLCHSYIKCIILPRQARDKHRESTQKKSGVSHSGGAPRTGRWRRHRLCQPRRTGTKTHLYASCVCSK
jgi:hypothetical protein